MKHLSRLLSLLILVSAGVIFTNCGSDGGSDPDPAQEQLDALAGTWTVTDAKLGSTDKPEFDNAQLSISTSKTFAFTKGDGSIDASPWPASVSWDFGSDVKTSILRHDTGGDVPLKYSVSGSSLTITIENYTGDAYAIARTKSVEGTWVFTFTK